MTPINPDTLLGGLDVSYEVESPLGPLTWYGIGGPAALLVRPADAEALSGLVRRCHALEVAVRILGGGANLLVGDAGVGGVVVKLDGPAWSRFDVEKERVVVGAGYDLMKLVMEVSRQGLGGPEVLAGIPGTVGGAVRMNAGGAFGQIGPLVGSVQVISEEGEIRHLRREQITFDYRRSNIVEPFILEVELALRPEDPEALAPRVREIFRYKKESQPLADRSAGCTFRNPSGPGEGTSAGAWIERAGLKGVRVGDAEISPRHANFIVTHDGCLASDVLALMDRVQGTVAAKFGVALEREVVVWAEG